MWRLTVMLNASGGAARHSDDRLPAAGPAQLSTFYLGLSSILRLRSIARSKSLLKEVTKSGEVVDLAYGILQPGKPPATIEAMLEVDLQIPSEKFEAVEGSAWMRGKI